jgi:hypothetical protein
MDTPDDEKAPVSAGVERHTCRIAHGSWLIGGYFKLIIKLRIRTMPTVTGH